MVPLAPPEVVVGIVPRRIVMLVTANEDFDRKLVVVIEGATSVADLVESVCQKLELSRERSDANPSSEHDLSTKVQQNS